MENLMAYVQNLKLSEADWPHFTHLSFWHKPMVINNLTLLKRDIEDTVPELHASLLLGRLF